MKRFLIVLLLFAAPLAATEIPAEFMNSAYLEAGAFRVHAEITKAVFPWSMPPVIGTHLWYGDVVFYPRYVEMSYDTMAKLYCDSLPFCVTSGPRPVDMYLTIPWDSQFGTYIYFMGDPLSPEFFVFKLVYENGGAHAVWSNGTFRYDGSDYLIDERYPYTQYYVAESYIPIVPWGVVSILEWLD